MIVHTEPAAGNPGGPGASRPYPDARLEDPRVKAFLDFVAAWDNADAKAGIVASRELRRLGVSLCLTTPARPAGGGR